MKHIYYTTPADELEDSWCGQILNCCYNALSWFVRYFYKVQTELVLRDPFLIGCLHSLILVSLHHSQSFQYLHQVLRRIWCWRQPY